MARMEVKPVDGLMESRSPSRMDQHDLATLISELDQDRAWLLEQIDRGRWPELRLDLAALERELGQLLIRAGEQLEGDDRRV